MVIEQFPKLRFLVFFRLSPFFVPVITEDWHDDVIQYATEIEFTNSLPVWVEVLVFDCCEIDEEVPLASDINVIRYSPGWSRSRSPPSTWRRSPGSFARSGSVSVEPRAASSVRPSTTRLSSLIRWSRLVDLVLFVQAANVKRITIRISMLNCQNLLLPIKPKIQYSLLQISSRCGNIVNISKENSDDYGTSV